ncbi:acyltransferase family protein [Arenicella xantha]|uniref:Peptidoglycan/LPS O-acetylase OafA/YrhL n=1 Tax=Arenicella xantha TaxID=644221 RepID=A0A395JMX3_9GAMM|nr:acyltransferase family protein [Arenicella xantha]RBP49244.1 peptidoglycan/LPS O-acetylase OafA/YrhL [Arenicella xantha]
MNQNPSNLSYRPEIDGLRAIAVVCVILYHAELVLFGKDWFEGGFVGVDIFFVISGYLITRIILSELERQGSFSFLNFYERRARRILPILLVVMVVSLPFGWVYLLPSAFVEFSESILSSLAFFSNFYFWSATTEYGAESSLLKPFLHTWSLSVEEQFYIVFPIIAILCHRFCKAYFLPILFALLLLSLQFSESMEVRDAELNFYLPFSRFWELAVGSIIALKQLFYSDERNEFVSRTAPVMGLWLIAYSVLFFDGETPHPSFHTIVPVLGVALIIEYSSTKDLVGKILGCKPFVSVGLISYSVYLWHFPIFAFTRIGTAGESQASIYAAIAASFVLSVFTYRWIETPFRSKRSVPTKQFVWVVSGVVIGLIGFSALVILSSGLEKRILIEGGFKNYQIDNVKLKEQAWSVWQRRRREKRYFEPAKHKVLIIGNSHAKDLFNALYQNIEHYDDFDFIGAPIAELVCFNETIEHSKRTRDVIYGSNWYAESTLIIISTRYMLANRCDRNSKIEPKTSDLLGLEYLVRQGIKDGKSFIVMGTSAEFKPLEKMIVADYVYSQHKDNLDSGAKAFFDEVLPGANKLMYDNLKIKADINSKVAALAKQEGVIYYDKLPIVCDMEDEVCHAFTSDGYKTLYDYGHYTLEGAKFFGLRLYDLGFKDLMLKVQDK